MMVILFHILFEPLLFENLPASPREEHDSRNQDYAQRQAPRLPMRNKSPEEKKDGDSEKISDHVAQNEQTRFPCKPWTRGFAHSHILSAKPFPRMTRLRGLETMLSATKSRHKGGRNSLCLQQRLDVFGDDGHWFTQLG
jgi:hypothetical protein